MVSQTWQEDAALYQSAAVDDRKKEVTFYGRQNN